MSRRFAIATTLLVMIAAACDGEFRFEDLADGGGSGATIDGGADAASGGDSSGPENGCKVDGDCKLPTLHCDAPSGSCVACLNDSNCAAPLPRCDGALHRCVACGVDGDCQGADAGQKCDVSTRHCVTTCSSPFSDDCPSDEPICNTGTGQCYRCTDDLECTFSSTDTLCQVSDGLCVQCRSDSDCSGGTPRCDIVSGECVQCVDSDDCSGATPLCDPSTLTCVAK